MEFRDLKTQFQQLKPQIMDALEAECTACRFISGPAVSQLEAELAAYVGVDYCVSCANGTDALLLALMAWDIGEGDAVFVPDFTFFASGEAAALRRAQPIFVDVRPDTFNMDPEKLEEAIQLVLAEGRFRPAVIVAVDLFGLPADYAAIRRVAQTYHLRILEDGAQGFGGMIGRQRACSFGDISVTSFFPAKPLGCYGDGGAVFTNDKESANLMRSYAVHGKGSAKYDNVRLGFNSRLDTIQAAILQIKLKAFQDYELKQVNEVAQQYHTRLNGRVKTPHVPAEMLSSWAQYTITLPSQKQRNFIQNSLRERGIPTMVYYPKPMHTQKAFVNTAGPSANCPITERLCDTVLSLPIHPYMSEEEIEFVAQELTALLDIPV